MHRPHPPLHIPVAATALVLGLAATAGPLPPPPPDPAALHDWTVALGPAGSSLALVRLVLLVVTVRLGLATLLALVAGTAPERRWCRRLGRAAVVIGGVAARGWIRGLIGAGLASVVVVPLPAGATAGTTPTGAPPLLEPVTVEQPASDTTGAPERGTDVPLLVLVDPPPHPGAPPPVGVGRPLPHPGIDAPAPGASGTSGRSVEPRGSVAPDDPSGDAHGRASGRGASRPSGTDDATGTPAGGGGHDRAGEGTPAAPGTGPSDSHRDEAPPGQRRGPVPAGTDRGRHDRDGVGVPGTDGSGPGGGADASAPGGHRGGSPNPVPSHPADDHATGEALAAPASPAPPLGEWTVAAGEHLWHVAEATAAQVAPGAGTEEVARYHRRLVEANRLRLPVPDNPDLVFPGNVLVRPAWAA